MIPSAVLIASLALGSTLTQLNSRPFASDATVSWEIDGELVLDGVPITFFEAALTEPAHAGVYVPPPLPTPNEQEYGCETADGPCEPIAFVPGDPLDWSAVYEVAYGIQIEGLHDWVWPGTTVGSVGEALAYLQAALQEIHAVYLRDAAVKWTVVHVHIRDGNFADPTDASCVTATQARWTTLQMSHPLPTRIMRFGYAIPGGLAHTGPLCDTAGQSTLVSRTHFDFSNEPGINSGISRLFVPAHEMGHAIGGLRHTQCYILPGGALLEYCADGGKCFGGPSVCPSTDEISLMGYCYPCNYYPAPYLRLGPPFGVLAEIARRRVLEAAADCLGPPLMSMPPAAYAADYDGDQYPDMLDACPQWGASQMDADRNGHGDGCDPGCAIGAPVALSWPLLGPLGLLLLGYRSRCPTLRR